MTPLNTPLENGQEPRTSPDTFPDKPADVPGQSVKESMVTFWAWFQDQPPERQEAYRQSVRDANNEDLTHLAHRKRKPHDHRNASNRRK